LLWKWDENVVRFYSKLFTWIENRILTSEKLEDKINTKTGKERKIKVTVVDSDTGKEIEGVNIYLWWYYLGNTDKSGKLIKKISYLESMIFCIYKLIKNDMYRLIKLKKHSMMNES
jgi:hypothetical protein